MVEYNVQVNNGVEAFGTEGKTISVNEVVKTVDSKFLAHHIAMHNSLIPEQVAADVLQNFSVVAAELMAQGMAIQFKNNQDVVMRLYPDVKIKGGNINLIRAKELDSTVTEITTENAAGLVAKAGVIVRAYAECEQKFNDLLKAQGVSVQLKDVVEKAKVMLTEGSGSTQTGGSTNTNTGGDDSGNGFGGE